MRITLLGILACSPVSTISSRLDKVNCVKTDADGNGHSQ